MVRWILVIHFLANTCFILYDLSFLTSSFLLFLPPIRIYSQACGNVLLNASLFKKLYDANTV